MNMGNNMAQAHQRGQDMIQHQHAAESLENSIDPDLGWDRLRQRLAGHRTIQDPVDQALFQ